MWSCPKCGLVSPDISSTCDCGRESAASRGDSGPSPIPLVVWIHLCIVVLLTLYLGYGYVTRPPRRYTWEPSESQQQVESALFWARSVVLVPLYLAFFSRRNWARLAVGIITLPLGLLLLVPRSVRRYTGAIPEEAEPGAMLGLGKE